MTNEENPVGKEVLSIAFGIGTISGVEQIQEGGDDYFVVDFGNQNAKSYIPQGENKKNRFLSEEKEFLKNIKKLKTEKVIKEFDSKKDRQSYFASVLNDCNLSEIISRVLEIDSMTDLVPNEKDKFKKLIGVLQAESSAIYKENTNKGKELIKDFLAKE